MRWCHKVPLRLRSLFRKNKADLDLSEELQFHAQNQMDEYVAQGMDPEEARHAAFRPLGGVEQIKEECRDARQINFIDNFLQDGRFAAYVAARLATNQSYIAPSVASSLAPEKMNPLAFVFSSMFLCGLALAASLVPARRALRVDPMQALRHE
jgi:hypothetical protein